MSCLTYRIVIVGCLIIAVTIPPGEMAFFWLASAVHLANCLRPVTEKQLRESFINERLRALRRAYKRLSDD